MQNFTTTSSKEKRNLEGHKKNGAQLTFSLFHKNCQCTKRRISPTFFLYFLVEHTRKELLEVLLQYVNDREDHQLIIYGANHKRTSKSKARVIHIFSAKGLEGDQRKLPSFFTEN